MYQLFWNRLGRYLVLLNLCKRVDFQFVKTFTRSDVQISHRSNCILSQIAWDEIICAPKPHMQMSLFFCRNDLHHSKYYLCSFVTLLAFAQRLPVWLDWVIYWNLGNFSKTVSTISFPKSPTFLDNFCKGVKIFNFSSL